MTEKCFELKKELLSGIAVTINNQCEWKVYNDIFVDGEYDLSIKNAIASASHDRPLEILDIGANVGFFTLRVADLIVRNGDPQIDFKVTLVEGSPDVYKELQARLIAEPLLDSKLVMVHGLVGERWGSAKIFEYGSHSNNSIFPDHTSEVGSAVDVPFIDLSSLYRVNPKIDLLKCDIEGSELMLLENYKELLTGVRQAVFEFHYDMGDMTRCFEILEALGFSNHRQLRLRTMNSVDLFWR